MNDLRRLPWTEAGKDAYVTPGEGVVNRMADAAESMALDQAEDLARRAIKAARYPQASAQELRPLLRLLGAITQDAVNVARLRGERLGMDSEDSNEAAVRRSVNAQFPAVGAVLAVERARDADALDETLYGQRSRDVGQVLQEEHNDGR